MDAGDFEFVLFLLILSKYKIVLTFAQWYDAMCIFSRRRRMDIIVCIKQVPDTTTVIQIDPSGKDIVRDGITYIVSPYDEFAIEEALKLKEAGDGTVTVLTVGPESAKEALRTGLAMGADEAIHVVYEGAPSQLDSLTTAKLIAKALEGKKYDLVFCGRQAIDDDALQIGSLVAEFLNVPQISLVVKLEINGEQIKATRTIEGGTQVVESRLPALITAQKGLNEPRYPSMKGILKARKKEITELKAGELGVDLAPRVVLEELRLPPARPAGKIVGSVAELVKALHEEIKVI
jgi:electron transfer flavoprotein beta subunit